jgi:clan AA aspartic protease (TIGR02281 family)
MTQVYVNQLPADVYNRLKSLLEGTSQPITLFVGKNGCKAEFADGQRLILNFNPDSGFLWLAGKTVAAEYARSGDRWLSRQDGGELEMTLAELIAEMAASVSPKQIGTVSLIDQRNAVPTRLAVPDAVPKSGFNPRYLLLLLVPAALIAYQSLSKKEPAAEAIAIAESPMQPAQPMPDTQTACEPRAPMNGASSILGSPTGNPVARADISIVNDHTHDMVVFFTKPGSAVPQQSIYVRSLNQATLPVAAGEYELMFSVGGVWCNLRTGFKGGKVSKLNGSFPLQANQPVTFSLQSTGSNAVDFSVFMRTEPKPQPPMKVLSGGVMELPRAADGHYYMQGSINGNPITFLVDTGASITTLKRDVAFAGGIRDCEPAKMNTANGLVDVCVGTLAEIRLGAYVVSNAVVAANPNTDVNLLGMNVLSQFKITTENGVMRLSTQ